MKKLGDFESSQIQKILSLKKLVLARLIDLVNINRYLLIYLYFSISNSCAKLVVEFFADDYAAVLKCLEAQPILQFKFLRSIMVRHADNIVSRPDELSIVISKPSSLVLNSAELPTSLPGYSMNELLAKSNIKLTHDMHGISLIFSLFYNRTLRALTLSICSRERSFSCYFVSRL